MSKNNCRVCGLYVEDKPWGFDDKNPTYEICDCCGVEFGNEDYTIESVKKYREKWKNENYNWFNQKEKPKNWDVDEQFKHIPKKYK